MSKPPRSVSQLPRSECFSRPERSPACLLDRFRSLVFKVAREKVQTHLPSSSLLLLFNSNLPFSPHSIFTPPSRKQQQQQKQHHRQQSSQTPFAMASRTLSKTLRAPVARQLVAPRVAQRTFVTASRSAVRAAAVARPAVAQQQVRGVKTIDFAGHKEEVHGT